MLTAADPDTNDKVPEDVIGPIVEIEPDNVVEPVTIKLQFIVSVPITDNEDDKIVEPVTTVLPITFNEPETKVEPVTCKVLVPKVATRVFSTEIATDPLATWFIPLGFSPVYLIFY